MRKIVSKSEFAKLKGRTPQAVSKWIAQNKITEAALVGSGHRAKIDVELAEQDLARTLDPDEQAKQAQPVGSTSSTAATVDAEMIRRKRKADAERAEHEAAMAELKVKSQEGKWVDAEEASAEFARELQKLMTDFDSWLLVTLARALAARFELDWKELAIFIKSQWYEHRRLGAADARRQIDEIDAAEAAKREQPKTEIQTDGTPAPEVIN